MTMLDSLDCDEDDMPVLATLIYRRMRLDSYTPNGILYGAVYIGNEHADKIADCTEQDLT